MERKEGEKENHGSFVPSGSYSTSHTYLTMGKDEREGEVERAFGVYFPCRPSPQ